MRNAKLLLLLVTASLVGCSYAVELKGEPALVQGKIAGSNGRPVGRVLLTLQPLEDGHLTPLEVSADGRFQGELVPGKYAYYVGKSSRSKSSTQALKGVDAKFFEPDMSRTIMVASGTELNIALD